MPFSYRLNLRALHSTIGGAAHSMFEAMYNTTTMTNIRLDRNSNPQSIRLHSFKKRNIETSSSAALGFIKGRMKTLRGRFRHLIK